VLGEPLNFEWNVLPFHQNSRTALSYIVCMYKDGLNNGVLNNPNFYPAECSAGCINKK
jgi:hypothetical protein